jgi:hypothetical protein
MQEPEYTISHIYYNVLSGMPLGHRTMMLLAAIAWTLNGAPEVEGHDIGFVQPFYTCFDSDLNARHLRVD